MKRGFWVVLTLLAVVLGSTVVDAASGWGSFKGFPVVRLLVDGREVASDVPAVNFYGRTLVPLRVVSERLGASVSWDAATQTASVTAPRPAPLYSTWDLSEVEVEDALKWARAGKGLDWWEILPMYEAEIGLVTIDILTPWACAVNRAHDQYKHDQKLTWSEGDFISGYSGTFHVWVVARGSALPSLGARVTQGLGTYEPTRTFDPIERAWPDGAWGAAQEFLFDATLLDRAGYVTVKAVVDGQEYVYSWDLSTLK